MNREKAVREGFYQRLESMTVDLPGEGPFAVPVYSNKNESDENIYVLLANQFGQNRSDLAVYRWKENITIEIYHVQQNSANYDIVDIISEKIESLILPEQPIYGNAETLLVQQEGWQFNNVQLESVNSYPLSFGQGTAQTVVFKQLVFSLIISKS
jgi:hypothetical protein